MQHIKHIIIVAIFAIFCAPTAWADSHLPEAVLQEFKEMAEERREEMREAHRKEDKEHIGCSDSSAPRICRLVTEGIQRGHESSQKEAVITQLILCVIAVLLAICAVALYHIYHLLRDMKFYVGYDIKEATEKITRSMEYVRNEVYAIQETIRDKMP